MSALPAPARAPSARTATDSEGSMKLEGILFFPVTPFGPDGGIDEDAYAAHVRAGVEAGAGGVFAACGTGEFHALAPKEIGT